MQSEPRSSATRRLLQIILPTMTMPSLWAVAAMMVQPGTMHHSPPMLLGQLSSPRPEAIRWEEDRQSSA